MGAAAILWKSIQTDPDQLEETSSNAVDMRMQVS